MTVHEDTSTSLKTMEEVAAASSAASTADLEKHTMVLIQGLQSEAGLGIIMNKAKDANGDGVFRYPVRIFALKDGDDNTPFYGMPTAEDKKLRTSNVKEINIDEDAYAKECFQKAIRHHTTKAQEVNDMKALLFWLATSYKVNPGAYHYGISYANVLREAEKNHKEAANVICDVLQNQDIIAKDPRYPTMYKEAVLTFCDAQEYMDQAIHYTFLIPIDTPENKNLRKEALENFVNASKRMFVASTGGISMNEELAQWHLKAAQALVEVGQDDPRYPIFVECLGAAYCLAGNNFEGTQWYRKAMALGARVPNTNLIIAQLRCPGMPLEDYKEISFEDDTLVCVYKNDAANLTVDRETCQMVNSGNGSVDLLKYRMPKDPNDPEVFGALLEKLKKLEEETAA